MKIYQLCQKVNGKDVVIRESLHPPAVVLPKWTRKDYFIRVKIKHNEQRTKKPTR